MPRYFFHCTNGNVDPDTEGTELEDLRAARIHAVVFAGAYLQDDPSLIWTGQEFRVEVTDERGTILFTVVTLAINAPSTPRRMGPPSNTPIK